MGLYVGNTKYKVMSGGSPASFVMKEPLPYDAEIEYLQFTGTQYIDTGFVPDYNSSIELVVKINAANTLICGSSIIYYNRAFELYSYSATNIQACYGSKYKTGAIPYTSGAKFKIALDKNVALSYDLQGNELSRYVFEEQTFTCPNTLTLGALHRGASGQTISINTRVFDMGAVVIKDNGTIVRNYIPVRVGQAGYMYDRVSGQLFGNDGTGDFVLGPDV